jgi:hypothetical protein
MTAATDHQAGPPKRALVLVKPAVASPAPPPLPPPLPPFPPPGPAGPAVAIDRWRARWRSASTGNAA